MLVPWRVFTSQRMITRLLNLQHSTSGHLHVQTAKDAWNFHSCSSQALGRTSRMSARGLGISNPSKSYTSRSFSKWLAYVSLISETSTVHGVIKLRTQTMHDCQECHNFAIDLFALFDLSNTDNLMILAVVWLIDGSKKTTSSMASQPTPQK